jgi:hypothetical protein
MSPLELIGTREASERLGESIRQTIRRVESGKLEPVAKMPGLRGAYVFNAADIDRLVNEPSAS